MFEYDYTTIHSFGNSDDVNANEPFVGIQNKDAGRLERRALLETLQQHVIKFTVPLRTDLSVGTIVKLHISEPELARPNNDITNRMNDNRYLITDMCVDADPNKYTGFVHIEKKKKVLQLTYQVTNL